MRWFVKTLATVCGLGYLPKAPGTAGSAAGLVLGFLTAPGLDASQPYPPGVLAALVAALLIGVISATHAERLSGLHDPGWIVIDECVGMWAVFVMAPSATTPALAAAAFVLFRLFDTVKPPPLERLARLPGGWGIMMDDLGASVYTVLVLWLARSVIRLPW